ncbi:hypothetical protein [Hansschlegelia zhihuaiae]|uniref:SAM-dependent DNA methyltransferase n=1 Tax=Hansschlegelia zhihuaiae TaxID=405005 RepID=A0A4Q0MF37_9HYPH|nr:hypothetical protein [Hansschlegelia zhihuaiae]RXF72101.1 hypothetical protein EK403_14930 [Hansschlegelia zhihuaiae]
MSAPSGFLSVAQGRRSPPDALDFFPTPPWATRALVEHVLKPFYGEALIRAARVVDPCCGEGHMIATLAEAFGEAVGTDVFDYGRGFAVRDALDAGRFDDELDSFVVTNPPFNLALKIALAALARETPVRCLALLVRSNWLEGAERFARLFSTHPPVVVAPFVERVPMVKGRYDPAASTATAYSWIVWIRPHSGPPRLVFIPPCRVALERREDARRWCAEAEAPLFAGAAT